MKLTVYGISSCDSCKKARRWLDEHRLAHDWVDVRENPPAAARVKAWVGALGSKPLRNTSGAAYRALSEDKKQWEDARWARELTDEPMLIKRPVLERDGEAVTTGFKPAVWESLLG